MFGSRISVSKAHVAFGYISPTGIYRHKRGKEKSLTGVNKDRV
jgi:hypothetical protein